MPRVPRWGHAEPLARAEPDARAELVATAIAIAAAAFASAALAPAALAALVTTITTSRFAASCTRSIFHWRVCAARRLRVLVQLRGGLRRDQHSKRPIRQQ